MSGNGAPHPVTRGYAGRFPRSAATRASMADETQSERPEGEQKPPEKAAAPAAKPPAAAVKKPVAKRPVKKPKVMETTPWADELTGRLREQFGDRISEFLEYRGQKFLVAAADAVLELLESLKLEAEFDYLVDVTAVDYPKKEERFEVIYILYSFARNERIRVKTRVKDGEKLESVAGVYVTANWLEREVYDMFGIEFANHPNLKRILMPDDWEGYPLRKDASILDMDNKWVRNNIGIDSGQ